MIKRIGERLQIDIRRVHVLVKFRPRIVGDVSCCYRDGFEPVLATRVGDVDRVLGENHRVIVSKRDRPTAEPQRCQRDLLRRGGIGELVPLARFGDVPVLTEPAAEIAPAVPNESTLVPGRK